VCSARNCLIRTLADARAAPSFHCRSVGNIKPFVPWHPSPVAWVQGLTTLTQDEKEKILWRNLESLLKLPAAPSP
jgi:hypothetical protein